MNFVFLVPFLFTAISKYFPNSFYPIVLLWNVSTASSISRVKQDNQKFVYTNYQRTVDLMRFKRGKHSELYQSQTNIRNAFIKVIREHELINNQPNYIIAEQNLEGETSIHTASLIISINNMYEVYSFDYLGEWNFKGKKVFDNYSYKKFLNSHKNYKKYGELIISYFHKNPIKIESNFFPNGSSLSDGAIFDYIVSTHARPTKVFIN